MSSSPQLYELAANTPEGTFIAQYSEGGLVELKFPGKAKITRPNHLAQTVPKKILAWHAVTESALKQILTGGNPSRLPPMAPTGTEFQCRVWAALRQIPSGQTKSYSEIARLIGRPQAVRAVGGACGANPIPVLVPCHRVIAMNQKIGGFSGGLKWKRRLLRIEEVSGF